MLLDNWALKLDPCLGHVLPLFRPLEPLRIFPRLFLPGGLLFLRASRAWRLGEPCQQRQGLGSPWAGVAAGLSRRRRPLGFHDRLSSPRGTCSGQDRLEGRL